MGASAMMFHVRWMYVPCKVAFMKQMQPIPSILSWYSDDGFSNTVSVHFLKGAYVHIIPVFNIGFLSICESQLSLSGSVRECLSTGCLFILPVPVFVSWFLGFLTSALRDSYVYWHAGLSISNSRNHCRSFCTCASCLLRALLNALLSSGSPTWDNVTTAL